MGVPTESLQGNLGTAAALHSIVNCAIQQKPF